VGPTKRKNPLLAGFNFILPVFIPERLSSESGNDRGFLVAGMCGVAAISADIPQADYTK